MQTGNKRKASAKSVLIVVALVLVPVLLIVGFLVYNYSTSASRTTPEPTATSQTTVPTEEPTTSTEGGVQTGTGKTVDEIETLLSKLKMSPSEEVDNGDYDRKRDFGDGWLDLDKSGCDTRNETLLREMTNVVLNADGCRVESGTLEDLYTGEVINFVKAESAQSVQIDHIFPLSRAYALGASEWTDEERRAFANDPDNVLAVNGPANGSKSDQGPSTWTPAIYSCMNIQKDGGLSSKEARSFCLTETDNLYSLPGVYTAFECEYAAKYVIVSSKYNLSITKSDRFRIESALTLCK